jgi:multidrug transporter EmrE-like cation transporter
MSPFIFVAGSILFSVSAQLLLKKGMNLIASVADGAGRSYVVVKMATSPWVIVGLIFYGLDVSCWIMALSQLELSLAYPFGSLSYVGIMLGSWFFFKENINRMRWLGIGVIILGLLIISQS